MPRRVLPCGFIALRFQNSWRRVEPRQWHWVIASTLTGHNLATLIDVPFLAVFALKMQHDTDLDFLR